MIVAQLFEIGQHPTLTSPQKEVLVKRDLSYCWMDGSYAIAADMHPYSGMKRVSVSGHVLPYRSELERLTNIWNK